MHIVHTIADLRQHLQGFKRPAFVPTMGNLHQGHLALVEQARQSCDIVVCSIFVNALQFGLNEDWDKYPRTYQQDCDKLRDTGCDYLFHPDDTEMYPNGLDTQSRVICPTMTDVLCGASRPGHFEGVTTVVSKLFNIVQPDEAIFGEVKCQVECEAEFDDAEIAGEMGRANTEDADQLVAHLLGELRELALAEGEVDKLERDQRLLAGAGAATLACARGGFGVGAGAAASAAARRQLHVRAVVDVAEVIEHGRCRVVVPPLAVDDELVLVCAGRQVDHLEPLA